MTIEAATAIERRIAGILGGAGDDPAVPLSIREIDRVRSAALAIREANLPSHEERRLLTQLGEVAKRCADPWMAFGAIAVEIRPDEPRPVDPRPYATAARRLRAAGYLRCPTCHLDVMDEFTIRRLERANDQWLAGEMLEAERREILRGLS
jgi:hypothetical protein